MLFRSRFLIGSLLLCIAPIPTIVWGLTAMDLSLPLTTDCGTHYPVPTFNNPGSGSGQLYTFTGSQQFTNLCLTGQTNSALAPSQTSFTGGLAVDNRLWTQESLVRLSGANRVGLSTNNSGILLLTGPGTVLQTPSLTNSGTLGGEDQTSVIGNVVNTGTVSTTTNRLPATTSKPEYTMNAVLSNTLPSWLSQSLVSPSTTFSIQGNLTGSGTLLFQEGTMTQSRLAISGSFNPLGDTTAPGSTVIVNFNGDPTIKGPLRPTYWLVTAPNSNPSLTDISEHPLSLQVANAPSDTNFVISYTQSGNLYLTAVPLTAFQSVTDRGGALALAKVLDRLVPEASDQLYTALNTLYQLPASSLNNNLMRLDGELNAETPAILFNAISDSWNPVYARMGISASQGGYRASEDGHLWMSGLGSFGGVQGSQGNSGFSQHSAGTLIGADTHLFDLFNVGLTTGYLSVGANRTGLDNTVAGNLWQIGTYADMPIGDQGHFGLLFGYDQGGLNTQNLSILGLSKSTQNVRVITAEALGSWRHALGEGHSLTPIIALESNTVQHNAYTDTGLSSLGASIGSYSADFVSARVQVRYDYDWQAFEIDWTASLAAGLREMLNQPLANSTVTLTGTQGASFTVHGAQGNAQTGAGLVNGGITGHLNDELDLELGYRGLYTGSSQLSSFQGNVSWKYDAPKKSRDLDRVTGNPAVENPNAVGDKKAPLTIRDPGADMANFPNSAFTLPQGGFYLESTPFSYSAKSPLTGAATYSSPTLLRYGLVDDVELRLFYTPYEVQTGRSGTVSGSGNLAFDSKIHLWDEWSSYFIPAAGFEFQIQTPWLASTAFQNKTTPGFTFNFDQQIPWDIGIEYNLGANDVQDPKDLSKQVWDFIAQWAAQRDITDDVAVFFNGYYNSTLLPRFSQKVTQTRIETRYKTLCHPHGSKGSEQCTSQQQQVLVPYNVLVPLAPIDSVPLVLGGGLIWTLSDHVQLFGNASTGMTQSSPSFQAYVGFAWTP
jgi:uncharacterized protein with beta-barrel porin domain